MGFVFDIPRTLPQGVARTNNNSTDAGSRTSNNAGPTEFQANPNLEQVSDWLTKIPVDQKWRPRCRGLFRVI